MKYNVEIKKLKKVATSGSLSDVVVGVNYDIVVTASKDESISLVHRIGNISLEPVSTDDFIQYNNLNEGTVLSWVTSSQYWDEELSKAEAHTSKSVWPENEIIEDFGGVPW